MGMFDTVMVPCPKCSTTNEFQSKGGECRLAVYDWYEYIPRDVLSDINRHSPCQCSECGTLYSVDEPATAKEGVIPWAEGYSVKVSVDD